MQEDHWFSTKLLTSLLIFLVLLSQIDVIGHREILNRSIELSEPYYEQNEGYFTLKSGFISSDSPQYANSQVLGSSKESEPEWKDIVEKYFPEDEVDFALLIIEEESNGNPNAVNWRDYHKATNSWGSFGLFQIGSVHFGSYGYNWNNRFDPETNVQVAHEVWKTQGWKRGWTNSYNKIKKRSWR